MNSAVEPATLLNAAAWPLILGDLLREAMFSAALLLHHDHGRHDKGVSFSSSGCCSDAHIYQGLGALPAQGDRRNTSPILAPATIWPYTVAIRLRFALQALEVRKKEMHRAANEGTCAARVSKSLNLYDLHNEQRKGRQSR